MDYIKIGSQSLVEESNAIDQKITHTKTTVTSAIDNQPVFPTAKAGTVFVTLQQIANTNQWHWQVEVQLDEDGVKQVVVDHKIELTGEDIKLPIPGGLDLQAHLNKHGEFWLDSYRGDRPIDVTSTADLHVGEMLGNSTAALHTRGDIHNHMIISAKAGLLLEAQGDVVNHLVASANEEMFRNDDLINPANENINATAQIGATEGQLIITAGGSLNNANGLIFAHDQVAIKSGAPINNNSGLISSKNSHVVVNGTYQADTGGGKIEAKAGHVRLGVEGELNVKPEVTAGDGIDVVASNIAIANKLAANGNIILVAEDGKVKLAADFTSQEDVIVRAKQITQHEQSQIKATKACYLGDDLNLDGHTSTDDAIWIHAANRASYQLDRLAYRGKAWFKLTNVADLHFPKHSIGSVVYELIDQTGAAVVLNSNIDVEQNFIIIAPNNPVQVGDEENLTRVNVGGKLKWLTKSLDVFHGGLFGSEKLLLKTASGNVKVGRVDLKTYAVTPCYLVSECGLEVETPVNIECHGGEIKCFDKISFAAVEVDHLSGLIRAGGDVDLSRVGLFKHRLIYENIPANDTRIEISTRANAHACRMRRLASVHTKTPPAILYVGGKLYMPHDMHIIGSLVFLQDKELREGNDPSVVDSIHHADRFMIEWLGGHKKRRKAHWYDNNPEETNQKNCPADLLSDGDMTFETVGKDLVCTGNVVAGGELRASFQDAHLQLGLTSQDIHLTPNAFQPIVDLSAICRSRPTFLYERTRVGEHATVMRSTIPLHRTILPEITPVILTSTRKLEGDNPRGLRKELTSFQEIEDLVTGLIKGMGSASISGHGLSMQEMWWYLQGNARAWYKANPKLRDGVRDQDLLDILKPMIIYAEQEVIDDDGVSEMVLKPRICLPQYFNNPKLLSGAGGLFAKAITMRGKATTITGFVAATEGKLECDVELIKIVKRQFKYKQRYIDHYSSKSLLGSSKDKQHEWIGEHIISEFGAEISGSQVKVSCDKLDQTGASIVSGDGGTDLTCRLERRQENVNDQDYEAHVDSGGSSLHRVRVNQHLASKTVVCPQNVSSGKITERVLDGNHIDIAAQYLAKDIELTTNGEHIINPAVVQQQLGTTIEREHMTTNVVSGSYEQATPSRYVGQNSDQITANKIKATAPVFHAPKIHLTGREGVSVKSQVLQQYIYGKTTGLDGLTYVNVANESYRQTGMTPKFSGFKELVIEADNGDVSLESPTILGEAHSKFITRAAQGNVQVTAVKLQNWSKSTTRSIGLSFTGSGAITAALQGKKGKALGALAKEVSLLAPLISLAEGGHREDIMANALLSIYQMQDCASFLQQGSVGDYIKSQFGWKNGKWSFKNLSASVRFGKTKTQEDWEEIITPMISVWDTVLQAARDVELHSVQLDGKHLAIGAGGNVCIVADEMHSSSKTNSSGVTVGISDEIPYLGVDAAKDKASSKKYVSSCFKLTDTTSIVAGEAVDLRGGLLATAEAFIEARSMLIETLLDEKDSSSVSGNISTNGNVGIAANKASSKIANMQAGIQADKACIKVTEGVHLRGGKITITDKATPLTTNTGESFYEYTMPNDGEELFHALGVSRAQVADSLLKAASNTTVRELIAPEIAAMLITNQLPCLMKNDARIVELYSRLQQITSQRQEFEQAHDIVIGQPYVLEEDLDAEYCSILAATAELEIDITNYSLSEQTYREYIAFYVAVVGSSVSYNLLDLDQTGVLDAIAHLYQWNLRIWEQTKQQSNNDALQLRMVHETQLADATKTIDLHAKTSCVSIPDDTEEQETTYTEFKLLHNKPGLIITPTMTSEDVIGYRRSKGIELNGSGLFQLGSKLGGSDSQDDSAQQDHTDNKPIPKAMVTPGGHYLQQKQTNRATISGDVDVITPDGQQHEVTWNTDELQSQTESDRHKIGFRLPVRVLSSEQRVEARRKAEERKQQQDAEDRELQARLEALEMHRSNKRGLFSDYSANDPSWTDTFDDVPPLLPMEQDLSSASHIDLTYPSDDELLARCFDDMDVTDTFRAEILSNPQRQEALLQTLRQNYLLEQGSTPTDVQDLLYLKTKTNLTWNDTCRELQQSFHGMGEITLKTADLVALATLYEPAWLLGKGALWGYRAYRTGELASLALRFSDSVVAGANAVKGFTFKQGMLKLYDMSRARGFAKYVTRVDFAGEQKLMYVSNSTRNMFPLTNAQKVEVLEYAKVLGINEKIIRFSENMNTGYGNIFGKEILNVGSDVIPSSIARQGTANARVSLKSAMAHEIVGHREATLAGKVQGNVLLEEVQASIRAARHAPGLSGTERFVLLRDGVERLKKTDILVRDVKEQLWLEEFITQQHQILR